MATPTARRRTDASPPAQSAEVVPEDIPLSAEGVPLDEYAGWDAKCGGWVHGDPGKQALALVNAADPKRQPRPGAQQSE
jgi:hypothetical protein